MCVCTCVCIPGYLKSSHLKAWRSELWSFFSYTLAGWVNFAKWYKLFGSQINSSAKDRVWGKRFWGLLQAMLCYRFASIMWRKALFCHYIRFSKICIIFNTFFYLIQFRISILVRSFHMYFPRFLTQNLVKKLADEKLSFLLTGFVQNISDLMIIGFPFGYMFPSCNFICIEAFSRLKCFELTLF